MVSLRRLRASRFLRLLALGILVLGLLLKPVLAANCELADLERGSADAQLVLADACDADDASDECCPGQACGECCTAGTAVSTFSATARAVPAESISAPAGAFAFEPAPYPVSIRPPIVA